MLKLLRWIERTNWRMIVGGLFVGLSVFSLVLAEVNPLGRARTLLNPLHMKAIDEGVAPSVSRQQGEYLGKLQEEAHRDEVVSSSNDIYLFLDLSQNILAVMQGKRTLRTVLVATGSGKVLQDPQNPSRRWRFETPRGQYVIESKLKEPVWIRPDWAFIEKEMPIPSKTKDRYLPRALGEYALGFGDGYFLHGGGPTSLLGFSVTHGCIQLNDEDLRFIFEHVPLGAKLIIV